MVAGHLLRSFHLHQIVHEARKEMATIEGVINTMVTPFTKDGDVDYAIFEKQVLFLLANGAKTLAYPMHYGESLNLRENEYKECAKIVVETANGLARKLQFDMHELLESIQQCYPGGIKHAMALMGRPVGDVRPPIRRLSPDEIKGIEKVLRSLKIFEREPKGWA